MVDLHDPAEKSAPELEDLYPARSVELEQATRRHLVDCNAKVARDLDQRNRSVIEAVLLFAIVDVVLIGISWKLILADVVVGATVGWAWDRWRTGVNASAALGSAGYLASLCAIHMPSARGWVLYLFVALVVAMLCGYMAKQRMAARMGI